MPYKIHVVTLPEEGFGGLYLANLLCELWRGDGHEVSVGAVDRLDADLGLIHIDRTWIPDGAIPENPHGRSLLNSRALDISKRRVSGIILDKDTAYHGPVIIKTNANSFGRRDLDAGRWKRFLRRQHQALARIFPWQVARHLPDYYPILEYKERVPGWVWNREELIVEKFIAERDGDLYVLRLWIFFGDQEYGAKLWSKSPVVKSANAVRVEYLDEVPDEIREMRTKLGFDFGKFDYVMADGKAILIDANKTPWMSSSSSGPGPNITKLAKGIHSYIGSSDH